MKTIITRDGQEVIVDDVDYDTLSQYNWTVTEFNGCWYATIRLCKATVYMHRMIMNADPSTYVDHINRNGLDNRRENLRITTQSSNIGNAGMFSSNTSGFKGVIYFRGKWRAQLKFNRKSVQSGGFADPKTAALIRDEVARRIFGLPTFINLPDEQVEHSFMPVVEGMVDRLKR